MKIYIDIETGPAANAADFMPEFEAPRNLKDPEKIHAALEDKRLEWVSKLALSAVTGKVIAVGVAVEDGPVRVIGNVDERETLWDLWQYLDTIHDLTPRLVGWNICGFDLPFLQRRSWMHDLPTPGWVFPRGRLSNYHTDLMRVWCGENLQDRIKLDTVCRWMGLGGKTDPNGGKHFAELWETDIVAAIEYLCRDVDLVRQLATRMRAV